jgi:hypothetical protein
MPRVKTTRFIVVIREARHGSGDIPALLDMLRYERGQVVSWGRSGDGYEVTIEVASNLFQPDRWASFMIFPTVVS